MEREIEGHCQFYGVQGGSKFIWDSWPGVEEGYREREREIKGQCEFYVIQGEKTTGTMDSRCVDEAKWKLFPDSGT